MAASSCATEVDRFRCVLAVVLVVVADDCSDAAADVNLELVLGVALEVAFAVVFGADFEVAFEGALDDDDAARLSVAVPECRQNRRVARAFPTASHI